MDLHSSGPEARTTGLDLLNHIHGVRKKRKHAVVESVVQPVSLSLLKLNVVQLPL